MAMVRKWRNRYVIDYYDAARKHHIKTIGPITERVRRQAENALAAVLKQLEEGTLPANPRLRFEEYANGWLEHRKLTLRPASVHSYESCLRLHLVPALGRLRLAQLSVQHVKDLQLALHKSLTPQGVNYLHGMLSTLLRDAQREGYVVRNVANLVRKLPVPRKKKEFLTPAEFRQALQACKDPDLRDLLLVAGMTGLRRGELAGLRWADLDLTGARTLQVRRQATRYGRDEPLKSATSARTVDLSPEVCRALLARRLRRGNPGGKAPVFPSPRGGVWNPDAMGKRGTALLTAGVGRRVTMHGLRHTFASLHLAQSGNMKLLQDQLGHAAIGITMNTYAHLLPGAGAEAAARLDVYLEAPAIVEKTG